MAKKAGIGFGSFDRDFDEFFDEMLTARWGCGRGDEFEHSELVDLVDRYEVRLKSEGVDERKIDVELHGQQLTVRAPRRVRGRIESTFTFRDSVDQDSASARWSGGTLTITLPKNKPRRIVLKVS
ncbi:MAG TPA: Hsp20 family protein [Candidatus Binataceae bacterium]|nr:Hsp20 family protein [Candidatus Binataceae bacterium]